MIKKIGEGAFGKVYKVRRRSDGNIYAMKVINISKMDKQSVENTVNEIRILSSIEHQNIVGYKECFLSSSNKEMNLVMEFVGGGDLSCKIKDL